jgi:hypothetical protein
MCPTIRGSLAKHVAFAIAVTGAALEARAQQPTEPRRGESIRFVLPQRRPSALTVEQINGDGTIVLAPVQDRAASIGEGLALLIVEPDTPRDPGRGSFPLMRVEVSEVGDGGRLTGQVGHAAVSKLKRGGRVLLFRPVGATTAQLRAVPELVEATLGGEDDTGQQAARDAALRIQSINNLKQIGIALHNFHDQYGHLPPAVVYGPDGKPWHSWRVLILPYVEQIDLYNAYDFSQPWDSPKNKQVMERMPAVFRDPLQPRGDGPYTGYAAIVGEHAAFSSSGMKMSDANRVPLGDRQGQLSIANFIDGTSNTAAVGAVSIDRQIPWTKPEDVSAGDDFSIGGPKGLAATIRTKGPGDRETLATPILFMDGAVRVVPASIDKRVLAAITTRDGSEVVSADQIGGMPGAGRTVPVLELIRDGNQTKARIIQAPANEVPGAGGDAEDEASPRTRVEAPPPTSAAPAPPAARPRP